MDVRQSSAAPVTAWDTFAASLDFHTDGAGALINGAKDKKRQRPADQVTTAASAEKRLNTVQGQLIEANGRIHVLETFVAQQEAWLDQERLDHAATDRALRETEERVRPQPEAVADELDEMREANVRLVMACDMAVQRAEQAEKELAKERMVSDGLTHKVLFMQRECDRAHEQRASAESENARVASDLASLEDELEEANRAAVSFESMWEKAKAKADDADAECKVKARALEQAEAQLDKTQTDLEASQTQLDTTRVDLQATHAELARVKAQLEESRKETHDACVETSRLGEALAEKRKRPSMGRKVHEAVRDVVQIACRLGDPQAESQALTSRIDYGAWRVAAMEAMSEEARVMDAVVIKGAAVVIGTLVPILYALYRDVGEHNEKLGSEYDALAEHCKQLEMAMDLNAASATTTTTTTTATASGQSPQGCKCVEFKAYIAQLEKEMAEAENIIHQQDGTNKDLNIRVQRRSALESVKIDKSSLLEDLVMVQDQRRQLQTQVQGLERSLAAARTATDKLQHEKGDLAARLLEAEKQIPPPRALLYVKDLGENIQELRRSLGPMGEEPCDQCAIYLGKARDADKKRDLAEQGVMEEQRRLVKLTEFNKYALESKIHEVEAAATERVAEEKKRTLKLERKLGEAETKLKEAEKDRASLAAAKDEEIRQQRQISERKVSAKNEQIETLEASAAQAGMATRALAALHNLLTTHRMGTSQHAERFRSAMHDANHAVHARMTTLQIRMAFQCVEHELAGLAQWLDSEDVKKGVQSEKRILDNFAKDLEARKTVLNSLALSQDGKNAVGLLRNAWSYAYKTLTLGF
jgi:hypothetical protein